MTDDLSHLPAGSLEPMLRASLAANETRKLVNESLKRSLNIIGDPSWREKERERRNVRNAADKDLAEVIRRECAMALEPIASSILYPKSSRMYVEGAIKSLQRALDAASELDPPESVA